MGVGTNIAVLLGCSKSSRLDIGSVTLLTYLLIAEQARLSALDALDEVVRVQGDWDAVRPQVAKALHSAGLTDSAVVAEGGGRLYPWPVGSQDSQES